MEDPGDGMSETPEGYKPLLRGDQMPDLVCEACGALVADPAVHDRWHRGIALGFATVGSRPC